MRRFVAPLGLALVGYALMPSAVHAQVIYVQPARTYLPPVIYTQPIVQTYYAAPPVTTYSAPATYSYYPPTTVYSYSAPAPVYTYSAPVYTYSAPVYTYSAPVSGVYTTRTSYGYGVFRPRGYYTESYYTPLR